MNTVNVWNLTEENYNKFVRIMGDSRGLFVFVTDGKISELANIEDGLMSVHPEKYDNYALNVSIGADEYHVDSFYAYELKPVASLDMLMENFMEYECCHFYMDVSRKDFESIDWNRLVFEMTDN